jgi:cell fate regulator YaaT (PSP1 superfamily)
MKFAVRIIKNSFFPLKVNENLKLEHGQMILVETEKGPEAHKVFLVNDEVMAQWQKFKPEPLPVIRIMNEKDMQTLEEQKLLEIQAFYKCQEMVKTRGLNMNLTQTRYTFDKKKITFYYTAPERVDFRELLKDLTQ